MTQIRPCRREDLEEVARLRLRVFERTRRRPEEIAPYLERLVFDGPWSSEELPSLVACDRDDRIIGFVGRLVRPFEWKGHAIRVLVPTQLMIDPDHAGLVAVELLREVKNGPQELVYADTANAPSWKIWRILGGDRSVLLSQRWRVEMRPTRAALGRLGRSMPARGLRFALRMGAWPVDRLLRGTWTRELTRLSEGIRSEEMTPADFAVRGSAWGAEERLVPSYTRESAAWMFEEIETRAAEGAVRSFTLTIAGDAVGEYVTIVNRGGTAQVVHLWARKGQEEAVMAKLLLDAEGEGALVVEGKMTRSAGAAFNGIESMIEAPPPWTLIHARDPELLTAIHRGDALLDRMEGEWWINL